MTATDLGIDGVAFIPWPGGPSLSGAPTTLRLYLVEIGAAPPEIDTCLEDWVMLPASEQEIAARASVLLKRRHLHQDPPARPQLDEMGVLHLGDSWVDLPPLEARLFRVLLDRAGEAVATVDLMRAGWPSGSDSRGNLRIQVLRLRRRLAATDLSIHTLPGRGYMLEIPIGTAGD